MLSNDGHMTPCAKLSALPDRVFKMAIQVPKAYIYPLFRVLSTTSTVIFGHQAEVSYKVGKGGYNIEMYFSFLPAYKEPLHL